jgi:hypothetical protein
MAAFDSFFLIFFYFTISYFIVFSTRTTFEKLQESVNIKIIKGLAKKYISFMGILTLITLVSHYYFKNFISVFFIATYLTAIDFTVKKVMAYKKIGNFMKFIKKEAI